MNTCKLFTRKRCLPEEKNASEIKTLNYSSKEVPSGSSGGIQGGEGMAASDASQEAAATVQVSGLDVEHGSGCAETSHRSTCPSVRQGPACSSVFPRGTSFPRGFLSGEVLVADPGLSRARGAHQHEAPDALGAGAGPGLLLSDRGSSVPTGMRCLTSVGEVILEAAAQGARSVSAVQGGAIVWLVLTG
ncbi:hypothetical protein CB1_000844029 [Camelus ferus]|nr:hypothetical protein CB1_000844029 [Camelus ferus]